MIEAINESYLAYLVYGSRSPQKLVPIHSHVALRLRNLGVSNQYKLCFDDGVENEERRSEGIPRPDVGVWWCGIICYAIYLDFTMSNLSQNIGNITSKILGQAKRCEQMKVSLSSIHVARLRTPYFLREDSPLDHIETSTTNFIRCVISGVRPKAPTTALIIVDFDEEEIFEERLGCGPGTSGIFVPHSDRTEINEQYARTLCQTTGLDYDYFLRLFSNEGEYELTKWLIPELHQRVPKLQDFTDVKEDDDFDADFVEQFSLMHFNKVMNHAAKKLIDDIAP